MAEIPLSQNLVHETVLSVSETGSTPKVHEEVVPGFQSTAESLKTSENPNLSGTADIIFEQAGNPPVTEPSQEKAPPATILNAQSLSTETPQPISMQKVYTEPPHPEVMTTPSSTLHESTLLATPGSTSQIKFSVSSVDVPNVPSHADVSPSTHVLPVAMLKDETVPLDTANSDPSLSSASSPDPAKGHTAITEASSPSDTTTIPSNHDILPVSVSPHPELIVATVAALQFDTVAIPPKVVSSEEQAELKQASDEKHPETSTTIHPLSASSLPHDSTLAPVASSTAVDGTFHSGQVRLKIHMTVKSLSGQILVQACLKLAGGIFVSGAILIL